MATMDSETHIFFIPLASPGHAIPMIDMAKLFAKHGIKATIIATPLLAARFDKTIRRATESGCSIQFQLLPFPSAAAGLPEGCESADALPTRAMGRNLAHASALLSEPFDRLVRDQRPDAIISDACLPWTARTAQRYNIPRFMFPGTGCFALSVEHSLRISSPQAHSGSNPFIVPGLPDKVYLTKAQLAQQTIPGSHAKEFFKNAREADMNSDGIIVNSFYGLESAYIDHYEMVVGKKVWAVGPVSLCTQDSADKAERGNKAAIDGALCMEWLASKEPGSVLYVCFGSVCLIPTPQLLEICLGLESSGQPFIWVVHNGNNMVLPDQFERRVEGRGLIIKGWAPQILLLAHKAVGAFMTHCGWNSVLEAVSAGVPMITWPLFGDQFYNEKLVVDVLKVGVKIGVESGLVWGEEEEIGTLVNREQIDKCVVKFMAGEALEGIKKRAAELAAAAERTMDDGVSFQNLKFLIEEIKQQTYRRKIM